MGLKEIFNKQGGKTLIKQYWRSGALFTDINQFIVLGRNRTSLEILRLSTQSKTKQKLEKKYRKDLISFNETYDATLESQKSNKVWVCWFQGIEEAPELVKKCYSSLKKNMPDRDIVLITLENMYEYVEMPEYIIKKWKEGKITHTHMTDLLRLELLIRYGGMWIDATVFCSDSDIPSYFFESDLFMFQVLKPGRDGNSYYMSSWLMSAKTNNKILMATRYLCYKYWEKNKELNDYFLLHAFMSIVLDFYPKEWSDIFPRDSATPHILLLRLFEKYDSQMWEEIKSLTPFHKLTYKFSEEEASMKGTYYDIIINKNHNV